MKTLSCLTTAIIILCVSACRNAHVYDKYVKELDSLKVVVEQAVDNFKTIDSSACVLAYSKQLTYTDFINKNLKDTVSIVTANNIQSFYKTGKGLKSYLQMRQQWLSKADQSIKQLNNLSHDLKSGSVNEEEAIEYISNEKRTAEKIIEELKLNTETIRTYLEIYNTALPITEDVVRRLNNGSLPQLVKPEL